MSTDITKIVINYSFGGFELSTKAKRRYLELCGIEFTEEQTSKNFTEFIVNGKKYTFLLYDMELRSDPRLIQVIEELGKEANGKHANLSIVELKKGTLYRININEDTGCENIVFPSDLKWLTA